MKKDAPPHRIDMSQEFTTGTQYIPGMAWSRGIRGVDRGALRHIEDPCVNLGVFVCLRFLLIGNSDDVRKMCDQNFEED